MQFGDVYERDLGKIVDKLTHIDLDLVDMMEKYTAKHQHDDLCLFQDKITELLSYMQAEKGQIYETNNSA